MFRLLSTQGAKMTKEQSSKLVECQRRAILECVRLGASHSFGLALPALISEVRDFRKDPVDEVLVRLALDEIEEALALCENLKEGPFVADVNLKVEALVRLSARFDHQGRFEQAVLALTRAIKLDERRGESLQPHLNALLAKSRAVHSHQQMQRQQQLLLDQNGRGHNMMPHVRMHHHQQHGAQAIGSASAPISGAGSLAHSSLSGLPGPGSLQVGVGVMPDGAQSHPSSPPALSHEFDWSSSQGVTGGMMGGGQQGGVNGQSGMAFAFGGGPGMGAGGMRMGGRRGGGLPGAADGYGSEMGGSGLPGRGLSDGGGYAGLHASKSFEEHFGDQTSFIMPGNRMPGEHNSRLPGGLAPNYGEQTSFIMPGNSARGPRQFAPGDDMGHTLNNKSFGDAFGSGGVGGFQQMGRGNLNPSSHHRSDSIDNMGLDEILAMPWLGEDAGAGGVGGLGGVTLATAPDDDALPEWSGTDGWSQ